MTDSFVAINLYIEKDNKKELINKKGIPLLFYANDIDNLYEDILKNIDFRQLIEDNCLNSKNYTSSYISYFLFKDNDEYFDDKISIQDLFQIDGLTTNEAFFIKEYFHNIFIDLYNMSMKTTYEDNLMFDIDTTVQDIYQKLQEKFKEKIVKSTVINYVRSELVKKKLSQKNVDFIIKELEIILKDEI